MLQSISSHRREAASPPPASSLHSKKAVTDTFLMLHVVPRITFAETLVAVKVAVNEAGLVSGRI
jgi:hypothetical protein